MSSQPAKHRKSHNALLFVTKATIFEKRGINSATFGENYPYDAETLKHTKLPK